MDHPASGLPLAAETVPSALLSDRAKEVEPKYVEDEEFPSNLPLKYDWMLQAASQPKTRRVLGAMVAVLLIRVSVFLAFNLSNASPSVLLRRRRRVNSV